jgi:hypothetical protein
MSLLQELRDHFNTEELNPAIDLLVQVMHYMSLDNAQRRRLSEHVQSEGERYLKRFMQAAKGSGEKKFKSAARFLEANVPKDLSLSPQ